MYTIRTVAILLFCYQDTTLGRFFVFSLFIIVIQFEVIVLKYFLPFISALLSASDFDKAKRRLFDFYPLRSHMMSRSFMHL